MAKIYVNLHSNYVYSNIIIDGYIEELKVYVKNVDWLHWDIGSIKGKPLICCMGGFSGEKEAIEQHLMRTYMFLQRMIEHDREVEIFVRDKRTEEWQKYEQIQIYTEGQLLEEEMKLLQNDKKEEWARENINKYSTLLQHAKNQEDICMLQKMLDEEKEHLLQIKQSSERRMQTIKELWSTNGGADNENNQRNS